jgi:hypothetical protein
MRAGVAVVPTRPAPAITRALLEEAAGRALAAGHR